MTGADNMTFPLLDGLGFDYVLTKPLVSGGMIARELRITPQAAQILVAELGLREMTGRRRYRAWGVL